MGALLPLVARSGQREGENRSALDAALNPDFAAVGSDSQPAESQPKPHTLRLCAVLGANLKVLRKDVLAQVRAGLGRHNARQSGASARVGRFVVLAEPPRPDADEITEKGYLNQRAILERRAAEVTRLFASVSARLD